MSGARLGKSHALRHNGCESENVSPEVNEGFTVAKVLLVVKRVVLKFTPILVPVCNCCAYPAVVVWLRVPRVLAPFREEALGELERVGANPDTTRGSKGWCARSTAKCEMS